LPTRAPLFLDEIARCRSNCKRSCFESSRRQFERLGDPRTVKVNVRIIASTNRNLEDAIRNGGFREDLFYRLNVFPITIPPLRQRERETSRCSSIILSPNSTRK
jgi:transcriptional regulator with GAF, ATPase, and Fis domain